MCVDRLSQTFQWVQESIQGMRSRCVPAVPTPRHPRGAGHCVPAVKACPPPLWLNRADFPNLMETALVHHFLISPAHVSPDHKPKNVSPSPSKGVFFSGTRVKLGVLLLRKQ